MKRWLIGLALVIVAFAVAFSVWPRNGADGPAQADESKSDALGSLSNPDASKALEEALVALSRKSTSDEALRLMEELREELFAMPREQAVEAICSFLESPEKDAATGLALTIGEGGVLKRPPSMRVALIDWLGQLDRERAADVSEVILATPTHPDEWALCLRNYAWAHPDDLEANAYLLAKWEEMVGVEDWSADPTVGFLEAFDVVVHTRSADATPRLARMLDGKGDDHQAVVHAAFLTLDRLMIAEPAEVMAIAEANPESFDGRESMLAQMVARADLSVARERELVMNYFLSPNRKREELNAFSETFPNANYMVSSNLLTSPRIPSGSERLRRDRAALEVVESWLADERFSRRRPWLETMRERLVIFADQEPAAD